MKCGKHVVAMRKACGKTCLGKQEEDVRSTHGGQQASKEGKGWGDKIRWEIVTQSNRPVV